MNSIDDFQVLNAIGKCFVLCRVAWNFLCETSAAYSQNEVITLRNYYIPIFILVFCRKRRICLSLQGKMFSYRTGKAEFLILTDTLAFHVIILWYPHSHLCQCQPNRCNLYHVGSVPVPTLLIDLLSLNNFCLCFCKFQNRISDLSHLVILCRRIADYGIVWIYMHLDPSFGIVTADSLFSLLL